LPDDAPRAVVLGCSGESLNAFEGDFLPAADPVDRRALRRVVVGSTEATMDNESQRSLLRLKNLP
jgi:hypothetical protein